ncbi:unnamed protein product [Vicia faba]|uniref:Beta-catenin-like protein 1 N-terminal domain-containing protein n=1 Tax=Vicia faba TaxID=3906 RepID=A0AAV0Z433_VICFA|nr:unnamed protein product [Vicia faba]
MKIRVLKLQKAALVCFRNIILLGVGDVGISVSSSAFELLLQNLHHLSDSGPDENAAIYNTVATIENLIEVQPVVAELVCEKTKLLGRLRWGSLMGIRNMRQRFWRFSCRVVL